MKHKNKILVEALPYDKIWGIGLHFNDVNVLDESKWLGKNWLGISLMNARTIILNNTKSDFIKEILNKTSEYKMLHDFLNQKFM
jgi:hypothetical protein